MAELALPTNTYERVETHGVQRVLCEPTQVSLEAAAAAFGRTVGARSIGVKTLEDNGDARRLDTHVESIIYPTEKMLGYFALGCIEPSREGGETIVYDGRHAARHVLENHPQLADTVIRYTSTTYDGQEASHTLVEQDDVHGPVLRYRSEFSTNQITSDLPRGLSEKDFYALMEEIVEQANPVVHQWQPGDLVIVNNRITLHSRDPYQGRRRMVRFRYDDPHFAHIKIDNQDTEQLT